MDNLTGKSPIVTANHFRGTVDFIRSGSYANLNDIAKPFGKRIDNWTRLKATQELFKAFRQEPCYQGSEPIVAVKGFQDLPSGYRHGFARQDGMNYGGTWAHPDIAI